jgi:RNA polymerase sigma-70 factor (ECF subfamily)
LSLQTGQEVHVHSQFQRDLVALVPKLRRFALSLTGNAADGDDLVQGACEKALRNHDQFQAGSRMDSWMYRIIQTLWLDDLRKRKVRGPAVDPAEIEIGDAGKAARLPEDRMMLARASAAMASLPEPQRAVLSLVAIEGLSYKEAAEVLDVPIGTVMSRLSRAREAILPQLGMSRGGRQ